jgi:methionyl-tRNA formyltransferase
VIAYGKIIPERIITLPKYGTINLHYSLLPKYRGATPVESAILHGDTVTGITIQHMRFKLDSGPILAQKEFPIEPTDTTPSLRTKLNTEALTMFPAVLHGIFDQSITPVEQPEEGVTRCTKINKEDGELHLSDAPEVNDRKYRAYYGSIGTFFYTEKAGEKIRVKIVSAHYEHNQFIIDEVVPENGKKMPYSIFVSSL